MSRPKLLILITKSNYGGAQRYVHELAIAATAEYDVVVACGGQGLMVEKLQAAGVRTVEITNFQRDISIQKELGAIRELWQLMRDEKPDIVHLNSSKAGLLGAIIARLARVPLVVFTIHGWAFHEPRPRWWKFLTWLGGYVTVLFAHRSIPISNYDVAHSCLYGLHSKLTPVIYNGVAATPLVPQGQARAELVGAERADQLGHYQWVTTIAELHPKKNIATAIRAVIAHNENPATKHRIFYCIMGDGVLRSELESLVVTEHATEYIYFCGYVTDAKQYLLAGDIFLLPSKQEGLPFALLEAGCAGLPTIASRVCGIPEVITDDVHGLLFDPYEVDSLVAALATMTNEPITRATFGTVFRERVQEDFSQAEMFRKTLAIYEGNEI